MNGPIGSMTVDRIFIYFSGDAESRDHLLFSEYTDYPKLVPGRDKCWAVGTELRQLKIYDEELSR